MTGRCIPPRLAPCAASRFHHRDSILPFKARAHLPYLCFLYLADHMVPQWQARLAAEAALALMHFAPRAEKAPPHFTIDVDLMQELPPPDYLNAAVTGLRMLAERYGAELADSRGPSAPVGGGGKGGQGCAFGGSAGGGRSGRASGGGGVAAAEPHAGPADCGTDTAARMELRAALAGAITPLRLALGPLTRRRGTSPDFGVLEAACEALAALAGLATPDDDEPAWTGVCSGGGNSNGGSGGVHESQWREIYNDEWEYQAEVMVMTASPLVVPQLAACLGLVTTALREAKAAADAACAADARQVPDKQRERQHAGAAGGSRRPPGPAAEEQLSSAMQVRISSPTPPRAVLRCPCCVGCPAAAGVPGSCLQAPYQTSFLKTPQEAAAAASCRPSSGTCAATHQPGYSSESQLTNGSSICWVHQLTSGLCPSLAQAQSLHADAEPAAEAAARTAKKRAKKERRRARLGGGVVGGREDADGKDGDAQPQSASADAVPPAAASAPKGDSGSALAAVPAAVADAAQPGHAANANEGTLPVASFFPEAEASWMLCPLTKVSSSFAFCICL